MYVKRYSNIFIIFRLLYWTDWGSPPKIEKAYMDGSNRKIIIEKDLGTFSSKYKPHPVQSKMLSAKPLLLE